MESFSRYGITLLRLRREDNEILRSWRNNPYNAMQMREQAGRKIGQEEQKAWFERIKNSKNAFYFIEINEPENAFKIIDKILDNPDKLYAEKLPYLMHERSRLLNDYNFFSVFANYAKKFGVENSEVLHTICSVRSFFGGKVGCLVLRLKRGLYKIYSKFSASC